MSKSKELLESVSSAYMSDTGMEEGVDESAPMRAVSFKGGQRHIRMFCMPGSKLVGNVCVRETSAEIMARRRGAKKAAKTVRGKRATIARHRGLTMKKRAAAGL